MEWIWITAGIIFIVSGLIGSLVPIIPGPPLSYVGLLFLQLTSEPPFELGFLVMWGAVVVIVVVADSVISAFGTKKFGGSPMGILGCLVGLIAGILFFPPIGIIIGPVAGAFIGELIAGKTSDRAVKAAIGSFAGYLFSTLLKVTISAVLAFYFFINIL